MAVVNVASPLLDSLVDCHAWRQCSCKSSLYPPDAIANLSLGTGQRKFSSHRLSYKILHRRKSGAERTICGTALRELDTAQITREDLEWGVEGRLFRVEELETIPQQSWNTVPVIKVQDLHAEVRCITVEAECSREIITLGNAYSFPGQFAQVKVHGGEPIRLWVSSPPFPSEANHNVLYKLKGDIPTGQTKVRQFTMSVKSPLDLHVTKKEARAVFDLKAGDKLELGPFLQNGMDLRPVMYINRFPTLLFFVTGKGIAIARSIVEAKDGDFGSLSLCLRQEVRLFYGAPTPSHVMYKESFKHWKNKKIKVRLTVESLADQDWDGHVGTLSQLWDADDLEYDPEATAVVVCAEKNEEEINRLLVDAGIPEDHIVKWDPNPSGLLF